MAPTRDHSRSSQSGHKDATLKRVDSQTPSGVYNALRRSVIKFRYRGIEVECSTEAEAKSVLGHIAEEDEKRRLQNRSLLEAAIASVAGMNKPETTPWTRDLFWKFIESLGDSQKRVLSQLIFKRSLRDEELRQFLHLDNNKQLAGVMSGISKQAAAHSVPARAVYKIENESKSGEVTKTYVISLDFLQIANQMNWPDE